MIGHRTEPRPVDWKPGDLALVEAGCWANSKVALRLDEGWAHTNGVNEDGDGVVIPIRPLVVIDPEATKGGALLPGWLRHHASRIASESAGGRASVADDMRYIADQIEAVLTPKPDEPTDPRARVTDRRDNIWRLLADGDWVCTSGPDVGEYIDWARLVAERGPVSVEVIA